MSGMENGVGSRIPVLKYSNYSNVLQISDVVSVVPIPEAV